LSQPRSGWNLFAGNGEGACRGSGGGNHTQIKLTQEAARIGGKVKQNSTDCKPVSGGFECKTSAVVCP
jgi:hypothetical protein